MGKVELIELHNEYIGMGDVQWCLEKIEEGLRRGENKFTIEATIRILKIDPLFIGYLSLLMVEHQQLDITISLPYNKESKKNTEVQKSEGKSITEKEVEDFEQDFKYQLQQYLVYAYISTGSCPKLKVGGYIEDLIEGKGFSPSSFVASDKIFPLLFIQGIEGEKNKGSFLDFDLLFTKNLEELVESIEKEGSKKISELPTGLTWSKTNGDMHDSYRDFIISSVTSGNSKEIREYSMISLARLYFIKALFQARIIHIYFKKPNSITDFEGLQTGNIKKDETVKSYYEKIKDVFDELAQSSILHQMIYSTLLGTGILKHSDGREILKNDTQVEFQEKIKDTWKYAKHVCIGLKELAKNILEHSKDDSGEEAKPGAISIRRYEREDWNNLRKKDEFYKHFSTAFETEVKGILEVNAFDFGEIGVMEKLIRDTDRLYKKYESNKNYQAPLQEDRNSLEGGEVGLKSLIDPGSNHLNFQVKRSMAHLGLLILSKLVGENKGILSVATYNHKKADDYDSKKRKTATTATIDEEIEFPIKKGTIFNISLPIVLGKSLKSDLPSKAKIPSETTAMEIKGIEELFRYEIIRPEAFKDCFKEDSDKIYAFWISANPHIAIKEREEEAAWFAKIQGQINLIDPSKISGKYLLILDFEDCKPLDDSRLFRLLGKMSLFFSSVPMIVHGISNDVFQLLRRVNEVFISNTPSSVSFWNENLATLVYSSTKIGGNKFYLTDVLWGKSEVDFAEINKMADQVCFNSTFLGDSLSWIEEMEAKIKRSPPDPSTPLLFYNRNLPLPFDLILKDPDGSTYFEKNASVLLQNPLNPE